MTTLEEIYRTYGNLMFYVANQILNNRQDAEDMVQEALIRLAGVLDRIEDVNSGKTRSLVCLTVEHKAIDLYRRKKRQTVLPFDLEDTDDLYIQGSNEIDALVERNTIAQVIASLPANYREILLLKYDNGFSEKEIAALLGMKQAAVYKTMQRARKKLEGIWKEMEGVK